MKKVILFLALLTCPLLAVAQKGISYQAVILDPKPIEIPGQDITGQPFVNGDVSLKFKIFSSTFVQEFEEVHVAKTDAYGLVNVLIGSQNAGAFSSLVWDSNPKNMQVWVSFDNGGTYTKVSEQVLTYNPYAIYAETAGKLGGTLGIAAGGTGATTAAAARTNLGLGNVDNTADANKPISTATQAALDTKANANEVSTALATKASAEEVTTALATKANANEVATALGTKANASEVTTALATKASAAEVATALGTKANVSEVTASLTLKEDVSNKANTPLGSSTTFYPTQNAVKTYVDAQVAAATIADASSSTKGKIQLAGDLSGTAAAPTVPGLALKANASEVTAALAIKADTAYVLTKVAAATIADASSSTKGKIQLAGDLSGTAAAPTVPGLALKANTTDVNTSLDLKAPIASPTFTGTVSGITKSMVGLGSVDNTTDAAKPISTATQAALDLKANAADLTSLTTTVNTNTADITATAADLATLTTTVNSNTASITANTSDILLKANTTDVTTALALKAPLESPSFSGSPNLPTGTTGVTQTSGNNSTKLATTAFVASAVNTLSGNSVPYTGATRAVNLGNYDLSVNGLTIGKGGGAASLNTAIGGYSLNSNSTGNSNTAIGYLSLYKNSLGANNTASGVGALQRNTTGSNNTANGVNSLTTNSEGGNNTSIGSYSLERNSTGSNNIAIGYNSLNYNTTAGSNTAIGNQSLSNNSTGEQNTANGYKSLRLNTGSYNTANGTYSLESNTTGAYNTALGYSAGSVLANGNASNSTSDYSVYLGSNTKASADDAQNEIVIGYNAIGGGSNTVKLGNTSVTKVITSGSITAGAVTYPNTNGTAGQVLIANANGNASWGSASAAAGVPYSGANSAVNLGNYNLTVYGISIGRGGAQEERSTAVGKEALSTTSYGNSNAAFGYRALKINGNGSENAAFGTDALSNNTTGERNTAIGRGTLTQNSTGKDNTALGAFALDGTTDGEGNTAIGALALRGNTTGFNNTAVGNNANVQGNSLSNSTAIGYNAVVTESNTIQLGNNDVTNVKTGKAITVDGIRISRGGAQEAGSTAIGYEALITNSGGYSNTAFGYTALKNNVNGGHNSAFGTEALFYNTDGARNTAIGRGTLIQNSTGNENTAVGDQALLNQSSGDGNTAIGHQAGTGSEYSTYGTFLGYRAGQQGGQTLTNATAIGYNAEVTESNTIQLGNNDVTNVNTRKAITVDGIRISRGGAQEAWSTAIGYEALITNTGGGSNTAFGYTALKNNVNGSGNSAFGTEALFYNTDGARNTAIGRGTLIQNSTGNENTAVGDQALLNQSSGDGNTAIGHQAGTGSEYSTYGTFLGYRAGQQGGQTLTNATAIGYNAEVTESNTIQLGNNDVTNVNTRKAITVDGIRISRGGAQEAWSTAIGYEALITNTGGGSNTAFGYTALKNNVNGSGNSAFGPEALHNNTSGERNIAIGNATLHENSTGSYNTVVGSSAAYNLTGSWNTAVGNEALNSQTSGDGNTAIGHQAGAGNSTYGTFLGYGASPSGQNLTNATAIGYNAVVTTDHTIQLGNTQVTNVNTSGAITAAKDLTVNGLTIGRGGGNSNDQNTAIGTSSLNVNTSGNRNTAIGYNSLAENQAGGSNTASGSNSLQANQTGMYNTASGTNSLLRNTAGNFNTAFGFSAGESDNSGYNTTSDFSVYLGSNTRASIDGAQNEVVIGFNAIGAGSNTIQLGNTAITKVNTRGTVWSNGTQLSSDLRLKTNIQPLLNSIDLIMKLNPVHYDKKNSIESSDYAKTENGFIAQELQKVLPYLVSEGTDQDKILSVDYNSIIPVLTKGIQEQQLVINALQNQIDELKLILEKLLNEKK
jgi:trimeric autotransporter adhesin